MTNSSSTATPAEVISYTKEELAAFAEEDFDYIFGIADNENTDASTLEIIELEYSQGNEDIEWAVASHRNTPVYILRGYVKDSDYILSGLAQNSSAPMDILERIIEDCNDEEVVERATDTMTAILEDFRKAENFDSDLPLSWVKKTYLLTHS